MEATRLIHRLFVTLAALTAATLVSADVVETKNGSRLVGKVLQIDESIVLLKTEYAGEIKVKQADVSSVTTDEPLVVRLASGTVLQGTLSGTGEGAMVINGPDGTLTTQVE